MDKELLLYSYFSNQLSEDEKQVFENLLETDDEFRAQFNFEKDLKRVIKDDKNQDLKMKLLEFEKEIKNQIPVKNSTNRFRQWSIAASIALLFGLGIFGYNTFFRTDYGDLYNTYFQEYPNTVYSITRGAVQKTIEREAFAAYESGDYRTALKNFAQLPLGDKMEYVEFYKAQSYLNSDQLEDAKKGFQKVISADNSFVGESHWYLALIYLKEKDKANAVNTLQQIIAKYDYKKGRAEELLKELN